jgi:hypothetical protein
MTCIIYGAKTKKELKERVESLNSGYQCGRLSIEDPSLFKPRYFNLVEIQEGQEEVVTNHPKRSWFAQVGRRGGKLYVK